MNSSMRSAALSVALLAFILIQSACTPPTSPKDSSSTAQQESVAAEPSENTTSEDSATDGEIVLDRINLNHMTREELLETIPDFGNRMVREFFEYQPYVSIQQFRREIGKYVDDDQVAFYESYIYVPVEVNDSDAETLKQIPGITDDIAEALMSARPFDSTDAFLAALSDHIGEEQIEAASAYLNE